MTLTRRAGPIVTALAVFLSLAGPGQAQITTGTIVGSVKDSAGAAVPGATVTVTETNKSTSSSYVTDSRGEYNAPFLIPGTSPDGLGGSGPTG